MAETLSTQIERLQRGIEALRLRIPGMDESCKRAIRRAAESRIEWLRQIRKTRMARGPRHDFRRRV